MCAFTDKVTTCDCFYTLLMVGQQIVGLIPSPILIVMRISCFPIKTNLSTTYSQ